jgi:hypothetical protein
MFERVDYVTPKQMSQIIVEVTAGAAVENACELGLEPALVLVGLVSEGGIAMRAMVHSRSIGTLPEGSVDRLNLEIEAAIMRFLEKCPNVVTLPTRGNPQ